jgi:hypothetical protein
MSCRSSLSKSNTDSQSSQRHGHVVTSHGFSTLVQKNLSSIVLVTKDFLQTLSKSDKDRYGHGHVAVCMCVHVYFDALCSRRANQFPMHQACSQSRSESWPRCRGPPRFDQLAHAPSHAHAHAY